MNLKYLKLADNCPVSNPRHQQYLERAAAHAEKARALDYKIYIASSPISSGDITLEQHAILRWRDFVRSEKSYREKMLVEVMNSGAAGIGPLMSKHVNGLIHNSVFRQSTIEALFAQIEDEYGL